jgi:hypothetical protein
VGDDGRDYTAGRDDLGQALEELLEAGFRVVCGPVEQEVFTSPDPAPPQFEVRIMSGPARWEGVGPSPDEAFEEALLELRRG